MSKSNYKRIARDIVSINQTGNKPYLCYEVVSDILSRIPAPLWVKHLKYVCKAWAAIPRDPQFIKLHLLHSKASSLYIQDAISPFVAKFIDLSSKVEYERSFPGSICDSNDGILLIYKADAHRALYVANPITAQVVKLPPRPESHWCSNAKIARIHNGKFKVIFFGPNFSEDCLQCYVLTVDSHMSWREISVKSGARPCLPGSSISIDGMIYWHIRYGDRDIVAVDLNDESSHRLLLPNELSGMEEAYGSKPLMKIGNDLCVASWNPKTLDAIDMWVLKDLQQSVWEKTNCIQVGEEVGRENIMLNCLTSVVTFLDDQQVLILEVRSGRGSKLVAFDVNTGNTETIKESAGFPLSYASVGVHINSYIML